MKITNLTLDKNTVSLGDRAPHIVLSILNMKYIKRNYLYVHFITASRTYTYEAVLMTIKVYKKKHKKIKRYGYQQPMS